MEYIVIGNGLITPNGPICDGLEGCTNDLCSVDYCNFEPPICECHWINLVS